MGLSAETVAKHNRVGDLWIIIDSDVYDISKLAAIHPGGLSVLLEEDIAGKDASKAFYSLHRSEVLQIPQYARLKIGTVNAEGNLKAGSSRPSGSLSKVPYAEPTWLTAGYHSPYYTDSHHIFQAAVRKFVEEVIFPDAQEREKDGQIPSRHVFNEMARLNIIAMRLGPGAHLKGRILMNGIVKPEEFDHFHELIINQEFARIHARGYSDGLGGGTIIALPPILNFGRPDLRDKIVQDALSFKKFISLAVTDAYAGSDVSGIRCHAKRMSDGWLVNGTKKWITNGTFADYFTVACRTDQGSLVVILIPRGKGVETRPIHTSYSMAAGTAYVSFDNVKVPYENTLGPENDGLRVILNNFNHERWVLVSNSIGTQRIVVEECFKYATQREVFGRPLISQAVVRSKLAAMFSRVESSQAWLENITFQMTHMNHKEIVKLAGNIAILKMYVTRAAQDTARDAAQIFGGRGITRSGMGKFIEHYHRTLLIDAVGGGAEDVMGDLGVRQALRDMPPGVRL